MNNQMAIVSPEVTTSDGRVITTTDNVAEYFGKQPHHVVQKIENLECSEDFIIRNFSRMIKKVQLAKGATRDVIYYEMTKDGFVFLAMGFTGTKAAAFKEAYINAFNKMEAALVVQPPAIAAPSNCRVLHTYNEHGVLIHSRVAKDDEQLTSPKNFAEAMQKRGYVMVRTEDFKSLTMS